jgi:NH3-dependent NAD+ synthetase
MEAKQMDEADLMPYPVLDDFIQSYIVQKMDATQTLNHAMPHVASYYHGNMDKLKADLDRFIQMSARAQWKRNRFANAFKVMAYDLDPTSDLRWPILQTV